MSGPMSARIQRLYETARERQRHYAELARTAGTPGRRETAARHDAYYSKLAHRLFQAWQESEHAP